MKQLLTFTLCVFYFFSIAQTTADFENFNIGVDSFLNGSDGSGGFQSGNLFLPNDYNPTWQSWSGWSISSKTDTQTPGFTNDLSSITGAGYQSLTYATTYINGEGKIQLQGMASGGIVNGFYITNNTYAYLSMRDGDGFSKKFGGVIGDDPDYFLLTIRKYYNGVLSTDSVDFYLADFRFSDNSQDYIINDWEYVDLTSLGNVDSLSFQLRSTDVGTFGMNTPAYFCIDDLTTADYPVSTKPLLANSYKLYPNPASDFMLIDGLNHSESAFQITNWNGQLMREGVISNQQNRIDIMDLPKGNYILSIRQDETIINHRFLKY